MRQWNCDALITRFLCDCFHTHTPITTDPFSFYHYSLDVGVDWIDETDGTDGWIDRSVGRSDAGAAGRMEEQHVVDEPQLLAAAAGRAGTVAPQTVHRQGTPRPLRRPAAQIRVPLPPFLPLTPFFPFPLFSRVPHFTIPFISMRNLPKSNHQKIRSL